MPVVSSWPVLLTLPLAAGEFDGDGVLTDAAIERAVDAASAEYFEQCTTFDAANSAAGELEVRRGSATVDATTPNLSVSAGVVEVYPERFVLAARIRADGDDGVVADVQRSVSPAGGVSDQVRDELIALAHAARHWH
jgi:hypothetical protein